MAHVNHCYYCFDSLICYYNQTEIPHPSFEDVKYPLFVTWKKNNQLRGCIGNFSPLSLVTGLRQYALKSALEDTRFTPIGLHELEELSVGISLLVDFEPASHVYDWNVGEHGIWIEFQLYGRTCTSTFLPEVASEQEWNHQETIDNLLRKGGFKGKINESIRQGIQVTRYKSSKVECHYNDYAKIRDFTLIQN